MKKALLFLLLHLSISHLISAQISTDKWQSDNTILGYSGSIIMPTAYLSPDRTLNIGTSHLPYEVTFQNYGDEQEKGARVLFLNFSFLPFMEVTFGLNKPYSPEFVDDIGLGDRTISVRFQLLKERKNRPAIMLGVHDTFSEESFNNTNYLVASKQFQLKRNWLIFTHAGYGFKVIDANDHFLIGAFGGGEVRWKFIGATLEYDTDRINAGLKATIKNRVFVKAALLDLKYFSASVNVRFGL